MKVQHHKKKSYPGRWLVKTIEIALVAGLVFFGLNALMTAFPHEDPRSELIRAKRSTWRGRLEATRPRTSTTPAPEATNYRFRGRDGWRPMTATRTHRP